MKLTEEQREEIRKTLDFNEFWWRAAYEGEPISQDEIDEVKELIAHNHLLLSSEQAWQEETERLRGQLQAARSMKQFAISERHETAETRLNQAVEVLNHTRTGISNGYELGYIRETDFNDVGNMIERINNFLFSLSQEGEKP